MRSVLNAGFIFWGLFGVFALIVILYLLWMGWVERRELREGETASAPSGRTTPGEGGS